jgi:hypothetical protein
MTGRWTGPLDMISTYGKAGPPEQTSHDIAETLAPNQLAAGWSQANMVGDTGFEPVTPRL